MNIILPSWPEMFFVTDPKVHLLWAFRVHLNSLSGKEELYFLSHIFDELWEKSPGRKSTGNSKTGIGVTVSSQCWKIVQVCSSTVKCTFGSV